MENVLAALVEIVHDDLPILVDLGFLALIIYTIVHPFI